MRLWLNRAGEVSLREQLITQVQLAILCRELLPGRRLPSTRELARRHGIHSNTVSGAHGELEEEGWLELRRGSGVETPSQRAQLRPSMPPTGSSANSSPRPASSSLPQPWCAPECGVGWHMKQLAILLIALLLLPELVTAQSLPQAPLPATSSDADAAWNRLSMLDPDAVASIASRAHWPLRCQNLRATDQGLSCQIGWMYTRSIALPARKWKRSPSTTTGATSGSAWEQSWRSVSRLERPSPAPVPHASPMDF